MTWPPAPAKTLDGTSVDEISVTEMAERNLSLFEEEGIKVEIGWDNDSPFQTDSVILQPFIDHPYQLNYPNGRVVYGTEPYGLAENDILAIAAATSDGWSVRIGQYPLWYPGRTTQILFEKKRV